MFESDVDKFLKNFEQRPEATSPARRREEEKYQRINQLRDDPARSSGDEKVWEGF